MMLHNEENISAKIPHLSELQYCEGRFQAPSIIIHSGVGQTSAS